METRRYDKKFKRYVGLTKKEIQSWREYNKKHGLPEQNYTSVNSKSNQEYLHVQREKKEHESKQPENYKRRGDSKK